MTNRDTYYVFRRNDGFIHATCGYKPNGWKLSYSGKAITFEILSEHDNWPDAYDAILEAKSKEANDES